MKMKPRKLIAWTAIYIVLALLPLLITWGMRAKYPLESRSMSFEIGVACGLLGLGVLGLQCIVSGRHAWFAEGAGQDNLLQFHRQMGLFAWLLILAHPILIFLGDSTLIDYLSVSNEPLRALGLYFMLAAVTVLIVTSLWRVQLGLQYEWWRIIHSVLAFTLILAALSHALLVNYFTGNPLVQGSLILFVTLCLGFVLETRIFRPLRMRRRRWIIADNQTVPGPSSQLTLSAVGHNGLAFKPGQYAWFTVGNSPFSLQQHPFSLHSDPNNPEWLQITAQHQGDFTNSLSEERRGTPVWIEGPYGVLTRDPETTQPAIFFAGGIGITPILSILKACKSENNFARMTLIYANIDRDSILFLDEINDLERSLNLEVIHVLENPPTGWDGETGRIDEEFMNRHFDTWPKGSDYYICGPTPLMDVVEKALRSRGIPIKNIHSERFEFV
ncbi:ferric reductase-like transmembrane domain-containing protein [Aliidiomarina sanyensis]|uniref:FAD-binding FR-type domain-containing protein n=1 Tax=Aliidiomarina sanyensis TaxID=1249555 RepID=A0A432WES4_9GAMM|nr:ferric reductase-like transmembrane domain-containing protein [Aliidiomarina sanyensis]RUO31362.1 hypothetical protein CWE11_08430 [Aliidiomarina sanyensis]